MLWSRCQFPVAHSCGLLNHANSFCRGMFKLNTKSDGDSLLYLLSHFECDVHTAHMLTQQHSLSPLISTVKSLFTHLCSSPLSLAARSHQCHAHCAHYVNNGWTLSGHPSMYLLGNVSRVQSGGFVYMLIYRIWYSPNYFHKHSLILFLWLVISGVPVLIRWRNWSSDL